MTLALSFTNGDELTLVLPVVNAEGQRTHVEHWHFNDLIAELEMLAEAAARGEPRASKAYQRIVWSLRRCKGERLLLPSEANIAAAPAHPPVG